MQSSRSASESSAILQNLAYTTNHHIKTTMAAKRSSDPVPQEAEIGFSFAGGGWLMCYMFGVAKALRQANAHNHARFIGTSAGSLAAIGLTLGADFDAITETVKSCYVPRARTTWKGPFQMREYLTHALTSHANLHDYEICNSNPYKCTVVFTSLSAWKARKKSSFNSKEELLQALIASCCATPLVGMPFQFEGEWVMDGGITENQPEFEGYHRVKRTVRVSPNFYDKNADIRPSQYIPPWWSMYPPTQEELQWVFDLGYHDGLSWSRVDGFSVDETQLTAASTLASRPQNPTISSARRIQTRLAPTNGITVIPTVTTSSMGSDMIVILMQLCLIYALLDRSFGRFQSSYLRDVMPVSSTGTDPRPVAFMHSQSSSGQNTSKLFTRRLSRTNSRVTISIVNQARHCSSRTH